MADVYEQNLEQKSSLTTSDYIRVVGSDNVSYKQPVSNVKEKWGLSWHSYSQTTREELLAEIDSEFTTVGQGTIVGYMGGAQAELLGLPRQSYYLMGFSNSANYRCLKFTSALGAQEYAVIKTNGTWATAPIAIPTRAEMDAVAGRIVTVGNITANSSISLTVASGSRALLVLLGADASATGIITLSVTSGGVVVRTKIGTLTNVTDAIATNTYTLSSSSSSQISVYAVVFTGSVASA